MGSSQGKKLAHVIYTVSYYTDCNTGRYVVHGVYNWQGVAHGVKPNMSPVPTLYAKFHGFNPFFLNSDSSD